MALTKALMYARVSSASGTGTGLLRPARVGATRIGYRPPTLILTVAGTDRTRNFDRATWPASERIAGQTNTLTIEVFGFTPAQRDEIVFNDGGPGALARIFRGTITRTRKVHVRKNEGRVIWACTCLDWNYQLGGRLVTKNYGEQSATAIALDLMSTYAPAGFTTVGVQAALPTVSGGIQFTMLPLTSALQQLAQRIGAYCYVDFEKDLHLFTTAQRGAVPEPIDTNNRHVSALRIEEDIEGVRNRILVEGLGASVRVAVVAGSTTIPVDDVSMFATSGTNDAKLEAQLITYTGVESGGGGGLVGPGASPTGAPILALASGAGVESGAHDYAVTFVTAAGESIAGPRGAVTVGVVAAPASAPTAAADPTVGTGPDPGSHDYAVTFVTGSGETTPGPSVTKATDLTAVPTAAPVPAVAQGAGVDVGTHDYALTFVTSVGETTSGPIGGQVTTVAAVSAPGSAPTFFPGGSYRAGGLLDDGAIYGYAFTFWDGGTGETVLSPLGSLNLDAGMNTGGVLITSVPSPPSGFQVLVYRTVGGGSIYKLLPGGQPFGQFAESSSGYYVDIAADTALGATAPTVDTTALRQVALTTIPTGASGDGVTSRKLYRRSGGAGLKFLAEIANNFATTYTDTIANASLGAAPPTTNTAYLQRIALAAIPTGGALVTSRKVYRTVAAGAQLKLLATIADNTTTTFTDTVTDASLGANVPVTNTATANQVALTVIPTGAAAVTSRKVYRTVTAGSQLKLLTTLADNTTTIYTDTTADASLGANVPTTDTSGLTQPAGQVLPGTTTLQVSSIGTFLASGWAVIGNGQQVIRYTSLVGDVLTGIPASGAGAIRAAVAYNSTVTSSPHLTGIPASGAGAIATDLVVGEQINLLVITEDATSIAAYGERELAIQDRRLSIAGAGDRGAATLALLKDPRITGGYRSSDPKTHAGRPLVISMEADWGIYRTVRVETVTWKPETGKLYPQADVQFASRSLDDLHVLLREMKERALIR